MTGCVSIVECVSVQDSAQPVLTRRGRLFPPVGVAGRSCHTAAEVIDAYQPTPSLVPAAEWAHVAGFVRTVVATVGHDSPSSALLAMKAAARYTAWAHEQALPLDAEVLFTPERVEHYVAVALPALSVRSKATLRSALRRVGRACTRKAPWRPEEPEYTTSHPLAPPYTTDQVAGYWEAAGAQATARRSRVLTGLLALGLGAGLRSREIAYTTPERVTEHGHGLWTITLPDRVVPIRAEHVSSLCDLLAQTAREEHPLPRSAHRRSEHPNHHGQDRDRPHGPAHRRTPRRAHPTTHHQDVPAPPDARHTGRPARTVRLPRHPHLKKSPQR